MEFTNYMNQLFSEDSYDDMDIMEDSEDEALLDPEFQTNMLMIEDALRSSGVLAQPKDAMPNIYDDQLLRLIDSVPLE